MPKRNVCSITDDEEARIQAGIAQDPDNPEWTAADFEAAKPISEVFPELMESCKFASVAHHSVSHHQESLRETARISLADAQARPSTVDHDRVSATTEDDIRRQMAGEGYDPDAPTPEAVRVSYPPRFVRERYGLSQAQFAAWIGVPVETWRQWELGSIRPDPAVNTLLTLLAREPEAARRSLGSAA